MIQEFAYLREIEAKICGPLGFIQERPLDPHSQVWCDLVTNNPFEKDYRAFLAGKLAEYKNTLSAMQSFDLYALNGVRAKELLAHFQRAQRVRSNLSRPGGCSSAEIRFIQAFHTLAIGYIAATAWEYIRPGRNIDANKFLAPFLSAGLSIKEVAQSAEQQGITDADTFLQFISGPAGQDAATKPQPKDAILNNPIAVGLLDRMRNAGKLDAAYQWIGEHTNYERAVFACYIDNKANIAEWNKAFCDLWGLKHRTLSKAYSDLSTKSEKTQAKYNEMLAIFDTTTK